MRGTAGRGEVCGRPARQRARPGFGRPQFIAIADGLFEMIAEKFCAAGGRFPDNVLEPVGESVMQLGTKRLGYCPVGRFLDEDVAEAVLLGGASVGWPVLHKPLRDEGLEVAAERAARFERE